MTILDNRRITYGQLINKIRLFQTQDEVVKGSAANVVHTIIF